MITSGETVGSSGLTALATGVAMSGTRTIRLGPSYLTSLALAAGVVAALAAVVAPPAVAWAAPTQTPASFRRRPGPAR